MRTPINPAHSCKGKMPYESRRAAQTVLRRMKRHLPGAGKFQIYECTNCGKLHIGHKRQRLPRSKMVKP